MRSLLLLLLSLAWAAGPTPAVPAPTPSAPAPVLNAPIPTVPPARQPEMIPVEAMEIVGHAAPDIDLELKDGGRFKLADQRGKIVVFSFWASWCSPCRKELPALSALAPQYKDVVFVAINVDKERGPAEKFLSAVDFNLPIAFDPDAMTMGQFSVMSMPTMYVIDRKGNVFYKKVGFSEEKGFAELIDAIGRAP